MGFFGDVTDLTGLWCSYDKIHSESTVPIYNMSMVKAFVVVVTILMMVSYVAYHSSQQGPAQSEVKLDLPFIR